MTDNKSHANKSNTVDSQLRSLTSTGLHRRTFLRGAGVALALPWLDAMLPRAFGQAPTPPRRMMVVYNDMSFMPQFFFPSGAGRDYQLSPYLQLLEAYRPEFTVFSGLSHPGVDGGHEADRHDGGEDQFAH